MTMIELKKRCKLYLLNGFHYTGHAVKRDGEFLLFYDEKTDSKIPIRLEAVSHALEVQDV